MFQVIGEYHCVLEVVPAHQGHCIRAQPRHDGIEFLRLVLVTEV